jgi:hypothetical protein
MGERVYEETWPGQTSTQLNPPWQSPQGVHLEPVNRQFERYEEIILYQETLIEAFYAFATEEQKKKLLEKLSPTQRRNLKRSGKLST